MRRHSRLFDLLFWFVMWAFLSVMVWGFVFSRITDTDAYHKITLYIDAAVPGQTFLAVRLEEALPPGVRMVRVRPFDYFMFDTEGIRRGDLYIIRETELGNYLDWVAPLPEEMAGEEGVLEQEGVPCGIPVSLPGSGSPAGASYIAYDPACAYYLFFGGSSVHVPGNEGAADGAAIPVAQEFLRLR